METPYQAVLFTYRVLLMLTLVIVQDRLWRIGSRRINVLNLLTKWMRISNSLRKKVLI